MTVFHPFLVALQFLTRIPVRVRELPPRTVARSLAYYPLVGLILGLLIAGLNALLSDAPTSVRAALVLTLWVGLTGALHLDGLADSADAWVAGAGDRERTLAIMKDPYCGPMAVATVVLVLLLKFASIQSLSRVSGVLLVFVPMLARSIVPLLFATTPYVRPGGSGSALADAQSRTTNLSVIAVAWIAVVVVAGLQGLGLVLALIGAFAILRYAMMRRLGGMTGDTAGALIEVSETSMLLTLALV